MTIYDKLADKIVELRKKSGLKQKDLAEKIGVHPTVISRFEKKTIKLSVERIESILDVLGFELQPVENGKKKAFFTPPA